MNTGDLIREARKAAGLTQKELAQKMGVVQTVVSEYETGKRKPKLLTLASIAKAIGCPWENLVGEDYTTITFESGKNTNFSDPDIMIPYSKLNTDGKQKVVNYAEDLATMPKYRNDQ